MTLVTRPADLDRDREEILATLEANLSGLPHARRFDWLYRNGPGGPASVWFICSSRGRAVGTVALVPRGVWVSGRRERCGQVADFAVNVEHRSLGPAVMLQRVTFEPVRTGTLAFCYDCPPHEAGMAPFLRLGMAPTLRTARYSVLLRTERQVERRLGSSPFATAVAGAANVLVAAGMRRGELLGLHIETFTGRFGDDFTALDESLHAAAPMRACRRAEDLNWQYRDDPLRSYEILVARRAGEVSGFVVLSRAGEDAWIVEVFSRSDDARALVAAARDHVRRQPTQVLSTVAAGGGPWLSVFAGLGFRRREEGPRIVAYATPNSPASQVLATPGCWFVQKADIQA